MWFVKPMKENKKIKYTHTTLLEILAGSLYDENLILLGLFAVHYTAAYCVRY